jgi:aspartate-semialdehyde dehydrogenase
MSKTLNVAIVGATGLVGAAVLALLEERHFPIESLYVLASRKSAGSPLYFSGKMVKVKDLAGFDFSQVQLAFFCVPAAVAASYVPQAIQAGCIVIDHSAQYRLDPQVPLVIPEINPAAIAGVKQSKLIACPDSATAQMLVALFPLHREGELVRIDATTCLAVSAIGRRGIEELSMQTVALLNLKKSRVKHFPQQVAFNLVPQGSGQWLGFSENEHMMQNETQRILNAPDMMVNPRHIQAPVFFGHSQVLHIETKRKISVERAQQLLQAHSAIHYEIDTEGGKIPTAVTHAANHDEVFVGRVGEYFASTPGLSLWVVADNVRRGAAMGSIQIAEILVKDYL